MEKRGRDLKTINLKFTSSHSGVHLREKEVSNTLFIDKINK